MEQHIINLTFPTHEECEKWEKENCPNQTYNGRKIFMIMHQCEMDGTETITTIWTI